MMNRIRVGRHVYLWGTFWILSLGGIVKLGWTEEQTAGFPPGASVQALLSPMQAEPGSAVELQIRLQLPSGWMMYSPTQSLGGSSSRFLVRNAPDYLPSGDFQPDRSYNYVDPFLGNKQVQVLMGETTLRRHLLISPDATAGRREVITTLQFEVFEPNSGQTWSVANVQLTAPLQIIAATKPNMVEPSNTLDSKNHVANQDQPNTSPNSQSKKAESNRTPPAPAPVPPPEPEPIPMPKPMATPITIPEPKPIPAAPLVEPATMAAPEPAVSPVAAHAPLSATVSIPAVPEPTVPAQPAPAQEGKPTEPPVDPTSALPTPMPPSPPDPIGQPRSWQSLDPDLMVMQRQWITVGALLVAFTLGALVGFFVGWLARSRT